MKPTEVRVPECVRRAILAHARRDRPNECCGFLVGRGADIAHAVPMRNVAKPASTRYRIDDAAHLRLRRALRGWQPPLAIVGVYHSHPSGGARASATDAAEAMYPAWVYLIIGLGPARAQTRAFRIVRGRAHPLVIRWQRTPAASRRALRS